MSDLQFVMARPCKCWIKISNARSDKMLTLRFDEFLRTLKQNIDTPHSLMVGTACHLIVKKNDWMSVKQFARAMYP